MEGNKFDLIMERERNEVINHQSPRRKECVCVCVKMKNGDVLVARSSEMEIFLINLTGRFLQVDRNEEKIKKWPDLIKTRREKEKWRMVERERERDR